MPASFRAASLLLFCAASLGCPNTDDPFTASATSVGASTGATGAADTGGAATSLGDGSGGCEPGEPGCECVDGMCLSPLVCSEGQCVWPPEPPPPETTGGDTTGGGTTGSGTGTCSTNDECRSTQVCNMDSECISAEDAAYEVHVPTWDPVTCDGGLSDGNYDLWWRLRIDGSIYHESTWAQGGCPGAWSSGACVPAGAMAGGFSLSLYDEDFTDFELVDRLWWDSDDDGLPDPISPFYLHQGEFDDTTGSGGHVRIEFTVVGGCE